MPKEALNYPVATQTIDEETNLVIQEDAGTQVSLLWDSGSENIQFEVAISVDTLREMLRLHDENEWVAREDGKGRIHFYTEQLRRNELQGTIKHARRARDAVFGADA